MVKGANEMSETFTNDISDEEALQNFLLDIECLDELLPWTGKFNLFDVLKTAKSENGHSHMLAWLLDTHENHGMGDAFAKLMIEKFVKYAGEWRYNDAKWLSMNLFSFSVYQDWKNVDVIFVSDAEKVVIAIVTKVDMKEKDQELSRYRSVIEKDFPDYERALIFISSDGMLLSDVEYWDTMTYSDIVNILDKLGENVGLEADIQFMIRHYKEMIRRDMVDNHQLTEICQKIYNKHKKALDLIYENRMDDKSMAGVIVKEALKDMADSGRILFDSNQKSNSYIMFHTRDMDWYLEPMKDSNSSFRTNRVYAYTIILKDKTMYASLELGGYHITDLHKETMEKILSLHKPNERLEEGFKFKRIIRTKVFEYGDVEELEATIRGVVEGFVDELLIMEAQLLFNLDNLDYMEQMNDMNIDLGMDNMD